MIIHDNLRRDNPYRPGSTMTMDHRDLYEALGLNPNRHLPKEGLGPRHVGNVLIWVDPKVEGKSQDAKRVWCRCPHCDRVLTAGKLHQHMKVHR